MGLLDVAVSQGCRQAKACEVVGIDPKTYRRWILKPVLGDQRCGPHTVPGNKLTAQERAKISTSSKVPTFSGLKTFARISTGHQLM